MHALPASEALTVNDLESMPDDGHRYELVDGVLLVSPAPVPRHQVVALGVYRLLHAARPLGVVVLAAPVDVVLSETTVLQPDVVVARRDAVGARHVEGPPLLVVEVLSRRTSKTDRGTKRLAYEEAGVPAYWLVDPDALTLTVLHLDRGRYLEVAHVVGEQPYDATVPYPCRLVPADLLDDLR